MIEISHKQAEWLISRKFDLLLPDEEWNALQNHLEHCPNCQSYQCRLQSAERKISQCLHARWDPVAGPSRGIPEIVSKIHRERDSRRIIQTTSVFYVAVFLLILVLAALQVQRIGKQESIPITGGNEQSLTITTTPTQISSSIPLIQPGQFPHIVAYESQTEGNAEIYLLNPGFNPVNLTQHPAEDTFPTWSPDGEWLAFLSNRATLNQDNCKNELYVISIAGNRLVQLTSETLVDWDGPLSWSADGKWIALVGVLQNESRQRSIYVVGVDGSGPRQLPDTHGGNTPKFAPYGDRLAFHQTEGSRNRIVIYHIDSGRVAFEKIPQPSHKQSATDVAYDWPADGDSLYYITTLPSTRFIQPSLESKCSRLVFHFMPNGEAWHEKLRDHFHLLEREIAGAVYSVSWAPNELVIYSVDFLDQDSGMASCETVGNCTDFLDFNASGLSIINDEIVPADLCILSDLGRGSWSLDMRWFIFTAYEQGVKDAGLYAIRMPGLNLSWQLSGVNGFESAAIPAGTLFRLSPDSVKTSLPRMRPFRARMKIEPHPGQEEMLRNDAISISR